MSDNTWIGVAMATLALIGTIVTGVFALVRNATDKRFDTKLALLEQRAVSCEERDAACQEQVALLAAALEDCQNRHRRNEADQAETHRRLDELEKTNPAPGRKP